jgi:hypothetical protein
VLSAEEVRISQKKIRFALDCFLEDFFVAIIA